MAQSVNPGSFWDFRFFMHSGYPFPHRALSRPIIKTAFMDNASERPTIFLLVMLAALTVFAPFVTDMYMSTLPSMT